MNLDRGWTESGPDDEVWLRALGSSRLSTNELLMLQAGLDLWSGQGNASFGRMFNNLDTDHLKRLCSLVVAVCDGPGAVEAWIIDQECYQGKIFPSQP